MKTMFLIKVSYKIKKKQVKNHYIFKIKILVVYHKSIKKMLAK